MSLAELLVALAIVGLLLSGVFGILEHGQRVHALGAARVESQQTARIALERLARDIRHAGEGKAGADFPAVSVAEPSRMSIRRSSPRRATRSRPFSTWIGVISIPVMWRS